MSDEKNPTPTEEQRATARRLLCEIMGSAGAVQTLAAALATEREAGRVESREEIVGLRAALEAILNISRDRERFVMRGPRGFADAERIASAALATRPDGGDHV